MKKNIRLLIIAGLMSAMSGKAFGLGILTKEDELQINQAMCVAQKMFANSKNVQCALCLAKEVLADVKKHNILLGKLEKAVPEIMATAGSISPDISMQEGIGFYKQYQQMCTKYNISEKEIERIPELVNTNTDKLRNIEGCIDEAIAAEYDGTWYIAQRAMLTKFKDTLHPQLMLMQEYKGMITKLKKMQEKLTHKLAAFFMPTKGAVAHKNVHATAKPSQPKKAAATAQRSTPSTSKKVKKTPAKKKGKKSIGRKKTVKKKKVRKAKKKKTMKKKKRR